MPGQDGGQRRRLKLLDRRRLGHRQSDARPNHARLGVRYPGYGWETNVGYSTAQHFDGIGRLGVTPHHRRSFEPVRLALSGPADLLSLLEAQPLAAADD